MTDERPPVAVETRREAARPVRDPAAAAKVLDEHRVRPKRPGQQGTVRSAREDDAENRLRTQTGREDGRGIDHGHEPLLARLGDRVIDEDGTARRGGHGRERTGPRHPKAGPPATATAPPDALDRRPRRYIPIREFFITAQVRYGHVTTVTVTGKFIVVGGRFTWS